MSEIDGNNKLSLWKLCGGHSSIITWHKTVSYFVCAGAGAGAGLNKLSL
jgi:hypothetical protein